MLVFGDSCGVTRIYQFHCTRISFGVLGLVSGYNGGTRISFGVLGLVSGYDGGTRISFGVLGLVSGY